MFKNIVKKASFECPLHSNSLKFLSLQLGYVRAREGGALLGQENTEPRAFEIARHWVADFWVVHHLGRAPMRLVRVQLNCAQMGNAVRINVTAGGALLSPASCGSWQIGSALIWVVRYKGSPGCTSAQKSGAQQGTNRFTVVLRNQ